MDTSTPKTPRTPWYCSLLRLGVRHGVAIAPAAEWGAAYDAGHSPSRAFYERFPGCVKQPLDKSTLTREDYEDIESYAVAAMIGLTTKGNGSRPDLTAREAFDVAEAMLVEKKARLGERPDYNHGA